MSRFCQLVLATSKKEVYSVVKEVISVPDDGYYPMILTRDCIECRDRETVPELTIMGRTETAIIPNT